MNSPEQTAVLYMLKAIADESRLTLLQLLHEQELSVGELAERLNLGEPTVSHHLARLREAGLVRLRMAGNQRFYRINDGGLAKLKQLVAQIEQLPPPAEPIKSDNSWIEALGLDPASQQVLREHTANGKITSLPARQKKYLVVLAWLATLFQPEKLYSEIEINTILKSVYEEDYVSLRRDLVDFGYLRRERGGGKYWLAPVNHETEKA